MTTFADNNLNNLAVLATPAASVDRETTSVICHHLLLRSHKENRSG